MCSVLLTMYVCETLQVSELMSYGPRTDVPQNVVLQWLIDDGNPQVNFLTVEKCVLQCQVNIVLVSLQRQQREAMLDPMAKVTTGAIHEVATVNIRDPRICRHVSSMVFSD